MASTCTIQCYGSYSTVSVSPPPPPNLVPDSYPIRYIAAVFLLQKPLVVYVDLGMRSNYSIIRFTILDARRKSNVKMLAKKKEVSVAFFCSSELRRIHLLRYSGLTRAIDL